MWRVQYALAKIRTAARTLLTMDEKSESRIFQGEALLRRMVRLGLLLESEKKLDYVRPGVAQDICVDALRCAIVLFLERSVLELVSRRNKQLFCWGQIMSLLAY